MSWCRRRMILGLLASGSITSLTGCNILSNGQPTTTAETATLGPSNGDSGDEFGHSVTFGDNGNIALVGAPRDEDPNGMFAGAAYVFGRTSRGWTEPSKLTPTDGEEAAHFGLSVAIAGSDALTAVVGAPFDDTPTGENGGLTYVFERTTDGWAEVATLVPTDGDSRARFGSSVAVAGDGTTALVGAPRDEGPNGEPAGSAYVFERAGGSWTQQAKLAVADGDDGGQFGTDVAIAATGDLSLVGAPHPAETVGEEAGAAYVFERTSQHWTAPTKLASFDDNADDEFGNAVALADDGSSALVGDPTTEAAYQFERTPDRWTEANKLTSPNAADGTRFGSSVGLEGTTALVGAPNDDSPTGKYDGVAYVFERANDRWTEAATLAADSGSIGDEFARSVALAGGTALIGAYRAEHPHSNGEVTGTVYVFDW